MINLGWGGHTNGAIDTRELVDISGRGDYVEPTAAANFFAMQAAIKRDVGFDLQPAAGSSCYRPESIQITFFTQRYTKVSYNTGLWWNGSYWKKNAGAATAAIPKTSNHGYARAIDLKISRYDVKAWAWMQAHAHEYGYDWATGRASGEDWHWESLTPPGATSVAGLSTPNKQTIPSHEENSMRIVKPLEDSSVVYTLGELTYQKLDTLTQGSMSAHIWNGLDGKGEPVVVAQAWIDNEIGEIEKRRAQFAQALKALNG